jgi:hypothetical protein
MSINTDIVELPVVSNRASPAATADSRDSGDGKVKTAFGRIKSALLELFEKKPAVRQSPMDVVSLNSSPEDMIPVPKRPSRKMIQIHTEEAFIGPRLPEPKWVTQTRARRAAMVRKK